MPGSWSGSVFPDIGMFKEVARIAERGRHRHDLLRRQYRRARTPGSGSIDEIGALGRRFSPSGHESRAIALMSEGHQASRFRADLLLDLHASLLYREAAELARSRHQRAHRLQRRHITAARRLRPITGTTNWWITTIDTNGMEEFIDVCRALWTSVEPDAFVWDRESGIVVEDPRKVQRDQPCRQVLQGQRAVELVPSPQMRPVVIQAGGSPRGNEASAHVADHVFGAGKSIPLMVQARSRPRQGAPGRGPRSQHRRNPVVSRAGGRGNRGGGAGDAREPDPGGVPIGSGRRLRALAQHRL